MKNTLRQHALGLIAAVFLCPSAARAEDFQRALENKRLILEGSYCAGLEILGEKVRFFAEIECTPDFRSSATEGRLRWLSRDIFLVIETKRQSEDCPPRTWVYQVQRLSGGTAVLNEYWTGWGKSSDQISSYRMIAAGSAAPPRERR